MTNANDIVTRTDRTSRDGRSLTSAFDIIDTATITKTGVRTLRFEITTSNNPDRKLDQSSIHRMTHTLENSGAESSLLKSMMTGEPSPVAPSRYPANRFSLKKLTERHHKYVAMALAEENLPLLVAWTLRELDAA